MRLRDHPYYKGEALKRDLTVGVPEAWNFLSEQFRSPLLDLIQPLAPHEQECERIFEDFVKSLRDNASQAFSTYNSKLDFQSFLAALLANHLAPQILEQIRSDPPKGFKLFEKFFGSVVRRDARRYFRNAPADQSDESGDFYHDLLVYLMQDSGRRLLEFNGRGAFSVYLRKVIRNYWHDLVRKEQGRQRLPKGVQKLSPLHQAAFRLMAWQGLSGLEALEELRVSEGAGLSEQDLEAAIDRIIPLIPAPAARGAEITPEGELPAPNTDILSALLRWQRVRSPESYLVTRIRRRELDAALERLRRTIDELPEDQRKFLAARYFAATPLFPFLFWSVRSAYLFPNLLRDGVD